MSLPLPAIDRLFARLMASYGRDFMSRYEGQDPNAIKSSWAHELAGYSNSLTAVAWALENLPERAPNVFEFRALCRRAPSEKYVQLPPPVINAEKVAKELLKLGELRSKVTKVLPGRLDWAHALKRKDEMSPQLVTQTVRKMYQDALRRDFSEAA